MNILYINHYAGSIYHGMEYRSYYLAREWVNEGHNVTIVASNYSHLRQKNIAIPEGKSYLYEKIDGINYIWCKTSPYTVNGLKRVINIFSFLNKVKKLKQFFDKDERPDVVIASSTYPFDSKVAAKIAKKNNARFIYEVHDLWPLTLIEVGGMSKWHPFIMAMQCAENFAYRHADKVVSLLPKAEDHMHSHGMAAEKFIYIPNGVAVTDWLNSNQSIPDEHQQLLRTLKQQQKFIIAYAGSMGDANALEYFFQAAKQLEDSNIAFVLVGDGPNKLSLLEYAKQYKLTNIFILNAINKLQIPDFLAACDALYIGWHKLAIYRFGVCPNKLFDYMLAKKPIIHSITAGNDLVRDANCGISVAAEDVLAITEAIKKLSQLSSTALKELGQNGYNYVQKYHDYTILAKQFLDKIS